MDQDQFPDNLCKFMVYNSSLNTHAKYFNNNLFIIYQRKSSSNSDNPLLSFRKNNISKESFASVVIHQNVDATFGFYTNYSSRRKITWENYFIIVVHLVFSKCDPLLRAKAYPKNMHSNEYTDKLSRS